jgi:hypothetical protein
MKRTAIITTLEEFKNICTKKLGDLQSLDPYELPSHIEKDLKKVNFDMENFSINDPYVGYPCGFEILENGLPVLFANAGGDWEFPICFCFYWDGKQIRAYIPNEGNVYNKTEKCAFGSEEEMEDYENSEFFKNQPEPSPSQIRRDIIERITIKK